MSQRKRIVSIFTKKSHSRKRVQHIPLRQLTVKSVLDSITTDQTPSQPPGTTGDSQTRQRRDGESANDSSPTDYFSYCCKILYRFHILITVKENEVPSIMRKMFFLGIKAASVIYMLFGLKAFFLVKMNTLKYCIMLGYLTNRVVLHLVFAFVSICKHDQVASLVRKIQSTKKLFQTQSSKKVKCVVLTITSLSMLRNTLQQLQSGKVIQEWNLEEAILNHSFEFGLNLLVWSKIPQSVNDTSPWQAEVVDTFWQDINVLTVSAGFLDFLVGVLSTSSEYLVKDMIFSAAITFLALTISFRHELRKAKIRKGCNTIPQTVWEMYEELKEASKLMNDLFGPLLNVLQADCFLIGARFLDEIAHGSVSKGTVIYLACDIIKICVMYYALAEASSANGEMKEWITQQFGSQHMLRFEGKTETILTFVLLEELKTCPIGLKSTDSIINSSFNIQLIGTIVHYFLILASAAEEKKC